MFLHFNRRPNEGSKWSTIYVQKSTLYLQFALQLNRRLRGRGAHFWSTIYLQSTPGQRIKADRCAAKVLKLVAEGQSYREISYRLGLSKNTVLDIVKRNRHLKNS